VSNQNYVLFCCTACGHSLFCFALLLLALYHLILIFSCMSCLQDFTFSNINVTSSMIVILWLKIQLLASSWVGRPCTSVIYASARVLIFLWTCFTHARYIHGWLSSCSGDVHELARPVGRVGRSKILDVFHLCNVQFAVFHSVAHYVYFSCASFFLQDCIFCPSNAHLTHS